MKQAWMPLYDADLTADTQDLSTLQFGAYLKLILHYWRHGGLTGDPLKLQKISGFSAYEWKKFSPAIAEKFYITFPDAWFHKRIEAELQRADDRSKKARENSAKAVAARRAKHQPDGQPDGQPDVNLARPSSQSQSHSKKDISISKKKSHPEKGSGDTLKPELKEGEGEFEELWNAYDLKVARAAAFKAFVKARKKVSLDTILEGVKRYRQSVTDREFLAHPATWLNGERWNDAPAPAANGHTAPKPAPGQNRFRTSSGLWVDNKFFPD